MKECIEKIIEIILENVSCTHQLIEEHPRGPRHYDPIYNLDDEQAVIEKCLKALPIKPELTKEWIEMKAKMFTALAYRLTQHEPHLENHHFNLMEAKKFIRKLVGEINGRK